MDTLYNKTLYCTNGLSTMTCRLQANGTWIMRRAHDSPIRFLHIEPGAVLFICNRKGILQCTVTVKVFQARTRYGSWTTCGTVICDTAD